MSNRTNHAWKVLVLAVLGIVCTILSLYAGWNLVEMINDQIEHQGDLIRWGADSARGLNTTLTPGPAERFMGAGLLGTYAPTIFAIFGTLFLVAAFYEARSGPAT